MIGNVANQVRRKLFGAVRRAFGEFLALPVLIVLGFVAFAAAMYWLDDATWRIGGNGADAPWLERFFGDTNAMSSLLGTIASSIITVTSITFSLLLLAVQQGAAALTSQVYDQFLRRRWNQFQFGFFIGLSIYVLITLVTVSALHRPIYATLATLILTSVALCMIVVLIYNTIDQMRPARIIEAIHRHILLARAAQSPILEATRRQVGEGLGHKARIAAKGNGIVATLDVAALEKAAIDLGHHRGEPVAVEVVAVLGTYVAYRDTLVRLHAPTPLGEVPEDIHDALTAAFGFDDARDLTADPSYGIEQLAHIGWTSISTARSNPLPGILVCRSLRDILSRWGAEWPLAGDAGSRVAYADLAPSEIVDVLEILTVATSESLQAQTLAEIMRSMAVLLLHLPRDLGDAVEEAVSRGLSTLGEHVLTVELDASLAALETALRRSGRGTTADAVRDATALLRLSLGTLNSRSTRVPQTQG